MTTKLLSASQNRNVENMQSTHQLNETHYYDVNISGEHLPSVDSSTWPTTDRQRDHAKDVGCSAAVAVDAGQSLAEPVSCLHSWQCSWLVRTHRMTAADVQPRPPCPACNTHHSRSPPTATRKTMEVRIFETDKFLVGGRAKMGLWWNDACKMRWSRRVNSIRLMERRRELIPQVTAVYSVNSNLPHHLLHHKHTESTLWPGCINISYRSSDTATLYMLSSVSNLWQWYTIQSFIPCLGYTVQPWISFTLWLHRKIILHHVHKNCTHVYVATTLANNVRF